MDKSLGKIIKSGYGYTINELENGIKIKIYDSGGFVVLNPEKYLQGQKWEKTREGMRKIFETKNRV